MLRSYKTGIPKTIYNEFGIQKEQPIIWLYMRMFNDIADVYTFKEQCQNIVTHNEDLWRVCNLTIL